MAEFSHIDDLLKLLSKEAKPLLKDVGKEAVHIGAKQEDDMASLLAQISREAEQTGPSYIAHGVEIRPGTREGNLARIGIHRKMEGDEPLVRLFRGEEGEYPTRGDFFTDSRTYAQNFAPKPAGRLFTVEVPQSVAQSAKERARAGGDVGYELTGAWSDVSYPAPIRRKRRRPGRLPQLNPFGSGHSSARRGLPVRSSAPGSGILR